MYSILLVLRNLAIAYEILNKSTGMNVRINQQEALKVVESLGFNIQNQSQHKPQRRRKPHRGSGRRYFYTVNKVRNS